jgi:hypothetical protein
MKTKNNKKLSLKVNLKTTTSGDGLWSGDSRKVTIKNLSISWCEWDESGFYGELRAYFIKRDWNTQKHGLIYTDSTWIKTFHKELKKIGFSDSAVKTVDYTEQGIQGDDYVSLDAEDRFIREFISKTL